MRKTLTALMLGLGSLPMLAQTPQTDLPQLYSLVDGKTIIKTDPFNDILGHLNLKVERLITRGASAQLSLEFSPDGATEKQSGAFHAQPFFMSNSFVFSPEQPRYIAASPQIRCYLNGGMGHGFYMEAYYRAQHSEFSHQRMYVHHHMVGSGTNFFDVHYNGSATMHSFGINIGAQWLFGRRKNIVLDWHILGVGRGFARGSFKANFDDVSHAVLEEAIRSELLSMTEQAVFTFDNKTDNNVKVSNLKYQSYIFNMGLSLGFRF